MSRLAPPRRTLRVSLFAAALLAAPVAALAAICEPDTPPQPGGGIVRICMPTTMAWNNDVVIWAHGYVEANRPLAIPEEQLCLGGSFCLPDITTALGFAFVTTSYGNNGMVLNGVQDVIEALDAFKAEHGAPRKVYLIGASEGGLVTTLGVEQHPELFDGGLAACGPIGDFDQQVGYYANFRVLFDYFYPGLMPGSVSSMPDEAMADWDTLWAGTLQPAIFDPNAAASLQQLLRTARSTYMMNDPATIEKTVHDALWYNVFATNDLIAKLGGKPFDNTATHYMGSADDVALNAGVERVTGDAAAFAAADAHFETTGQLARPLVTLHTWMDQQVAYRQELLYSMKVKDAGATAQRVNYPVFRYGHCNFRPFEALVSFAILVAKVMGAPPAGAEMLLPDAAERQAYLDAMAARGYPVGLSPSGPASPAPTPSPRRQTTATD
jgi:pimeloyl-ACP methyl ester carboxylesterase